MAGRIVCVVGDDGSWPAARAALGRLALHLEKRPNQAASPADRDAVADLSLSAAGLAELEDSDVRHELKSFLDRTGLRLHGAEIDTRGLPGWHRPHRAARAIGLAELLADLNVQRTQLVLSSSLCLPGGDAHPDAGRAADYLLRFAAFCHDLQVQTRRKVRLCLRNSRIGTGEALRETRGFIDTELRSPEGVRKLAGLAAISRDEAAEALRHLFAVAAGPVRDRQPGHGLGEWLGMAPIRSLEIEPSDAGLVRPPGAADAMRRAGAHPVDDRPDIWVAGTPVPDACPDPDPAGAAMATRVSGRVA